MKHEAKFFWIGVHRMRSLIAVAVLSCLFLLPASSAYAQCETSSGASNAFNEMAQDVVERYNEFAEQEKNFIDKKLNDTAKKEINARFDEFSKNVTKAFEELWKRSSPDDDYPRLVDAMKMQSKQMSVARTTQTMDIGKLVDAEMQSEAVAELNKKEFEAQKRYVVNESGCLVDSTAKDRTKLEVMSRALARGFAQDAQPRALNAAPTTTGGTGFQAFSRELAQASAEGPASQQRVLIEEYQQYWCDPERGDQGCTTPGSLAGKNTDLPGLLWGDKQSIDLSTDDGRRIKDAVLRTIIAPRVRQPIPPGVVGTTRGDQEMVLRRADAARLNTVYNVVGQMLAERVGLPGSNGSSKAILESAGVAPENASFDDSYAQIRQAMGRGRFNDPNFVASLIASPAEAVRNQIGINATKMQLMNDILKRQEEMLFMEAAAYASELDNRVPQAGFSDTPQRSN
jgi:hypothetical protein